MEEKTFQLTDIHADALKLIISFLDSKSLLCFRSVNKFCESISQKDFLARIASQRITQIVCGFTSSYMLKADGTLYAWGNHDRGRPVHALNQYQPLSGLPEKVQGIKNVKSIAVGRSHILALTGDGRVYGWGQNMEGQVGVGNQKTYETPQPITDLKNIAAIWADSFLSFAMTVDGILYGWGKNPMGQLGLGHKNVQHKPVIVPNLKEVVSLGFSDHVIALTKNNEVYGWGSNNCGQLGLGDKNEWLTPKRIPFDEKISKISVCDSYSVAYTENGNLFAWGKGDLLGTKFDTCTPQQMPGWKVHSLSFGNGNSFLLTQTGILYGYGNNRWGSLGLGHNNKVLTPQVVTGLQDVTQIQNRNHTLALTREGSLYTCGYNNTGQLGHGDRTHRNTPTLLVKQNLISILKSIRDRKYKQVLAQPNSPEIKQELLNQLNAYISNKKVYPIQERSAEFFGSPAKRRKLDLEPGPADKLKDFITAGNTLKEIEEEITAHHFFNNDPDFETCLGDMLKSLEQAKASIWESISKTIVYP